MLEDVHRFFYLFIYDLWLWFRSLNWWLIFDGVCVCACYPFLGYHKTFISTESGRDIYKGQEFSFYFLLIKRLYLIYRCPFDLKDYVRVDVNPFLVIFSCCIFIGWSHRSFLFCYQAFPVSRSWVEENGLPDNKGALPLCRWGYKFSYDLYYLSDSLKQVLFY
jgi:hypothetical protein